MTKLILKLAGSQNLLWNFGTLRSCHIKLLRCQTSMQNAGQEPIDFQISREFSTSNQLCRSLYKLSLNKSRVNMQKTKQLQFTSDYIQNKVVEYNLGTRRLALMMGKDPETFSQEDIDDSIEYLFPSDLNKDVLPQLQHPSDVFPAKTVIKTDEHGRPLNSFFYTSNPAYNEIMHEIYEQRLQVQKAHAIELFEQRNKKKKRSKDEGAAVMQNLRTTIWLTKEEVETNLLPGVTLSDRQYSDLISQVTRLLNEPKAHLAEEYILKFRKEVVKQVFKESIAEPQLDENGVYSVEATGERKTSKAKVKLSYPGSGKITVNGKDFGKFFFAFRSREIVISPFSLLGYQRMFDIEANVEWPLQNNFNKRVKILNENQRNVLEDSMSSRTSHAVAIRLAVSNALRSFIQPYQIEVLRQAGLLSYDIRVKERKLPGRRKARKRFTWKKR